MIILNSDNKDHRAIWISLVEKELAGEPMLLPSYLELFCSAGDKAMCAFGEFNSGKILYPFIKRIIPGVRDVFDLTSSYGYGGPCVIGCVSSEEKATFWSSTQTAAGEANVVSEFIRFMLGREEECDYPGQIVKRSSNVIRLLDIDLDTMWMEFGHKIRKNVIKASSFDLQFVVDKGENLEDFMRIYYSTMDRCDAKENYYFKRDFYEKLNTELTNHAIYFYVLKDGQVISTELVLYGKENMYSYLGGSMSEFFYMRPNDFLKYEIIRWGHEKGIQNYILGGGYKGDDGIFRYKQNFAPEGVVKFFTGQRVFDQEKYEKLVSLRNKKAIREGGEPVSGETHSFFPLYRV
jgi:hypothetical protein